jgi:hypothetical protein
VGPDGGRPDFAAAFETPIDATPPGRCAFTNPRSIGPWNGISLDPADPLMVWGSPVHAQPGASRTGCGWQGNVTAYRD